MLLLAITYDVQSSRPQKNTHVFRQDCSLIDSLVTMHHWIAISPFLLVKPTEMWEVADLEFVLCKQYPLYCCQCPVCPACLNNPTAISGKCGMPRKVVIKKLKGDRDSLIITCEDQMEIQCVAKYLAHEFNGKLRSKGVKLPRLDFLMVWSIQMAERQTPFYANMESFVAGHFEKFNSNLGYVSGCHDVLQAFSHWTHHVTNGYLMVVDLQVSTLQKVHGSECQYCSPQE